MLKELSIYENLGTPKYYFELFNLLNDKNQDDWTSLNIQKYFLNRLIDGRSIFDGCIPLAHFLGLVSINSDDAFILDTSFAKYLKSEKYMCDKFLEKLFFTLSEDEIFYEIFSSKNMSYDIIYHSIQINNSAFSFKHSNFKQLLLDFDILQIHPTKEINKFIINSRYKKLFYKVILPEIKKRKIGIEELKKSLEQKQIYGEEAENFVLKFEKERLNSKEGIEWVAEYSIAEGYDIASFNEIESTINDRFIEVKSYDGTPYFFWSRNEMDVARIKKENYFLYLVNRKYIDKEDYVPMIIQNPHEEVLKNDLKWEKTVEKIKVQINK